MRVLLPSSCALCQPLHPLYLIRPHVPLQLFTVDQSYRITLEFSTSQSEVGDNVEEIKEYVWGLGRVLGGEGQNLRAWI